MTSGPLKALYHAATGPVTRADIEAVLARAGITLGDVLMVHSDVGTFGKLGDVVDRNEFLEEILQAFRNVLGRNGTLIVPAYTYSFCKGESFNVKGSRSLAGIFSEYVRVRPDTVRSEEPIFSHAGFGSKASFLLEKVGPDCFGKSSFFDRFYELDGKLVNFGKFFDITYIHYIEQCFGVSYRYMKKFSGTLIDVSGCARSHEADYYVRHLYDDGREVIYDMPLLGDAMERRGLLKRVPLGDSAVLCSSAKDCFRVGTEMLRRNELAFLKGNTLFSSMGTSAGGHS